MTTFSTISDPFSQKILSRYEGFDFYTVKVWKESGGFLLSKEVSLQGKLTHITSKIFHLTVAFFWDLGRAISYGIWGGNYKNPHLFQEIKTHSKSEVGLAFLENMGRKERLETLARLEKKRAFSPLSCKKNQTYWTLIEEEKKSLITEIEEMSSEEVFKYLKAYYEGEIFPLLKHPLYEEKGLFDPLGRDLSQLLYFQIGCQLRSFICLSLIEKLAGEIKEKLQKGEFLEKQFKEAGSYYRAQAQEVCSLIFLSTDQKNYLGRVLFFSLKEEINACLINIVRGDLTSSSINRLSQASEVIDEAQKAMQKVSNLLKIHLDFVFPIEEIGLIVSRAIESETGYPLSEFYLMESAANNAFLQDETLSREEISQRFPEEFDWVRFILAFCEPGSTVPFSKGSS